MSEYPELVFALRLASHLRRPLYEINESMSAAEFALWMWFYQTHGFDVDRLEWAAANAGAAMVRSNGTDVKAAELIPVFEVPDPAKKRERIRAWLDGA